jgi:hypothetical protein
VVIAAESLLQFRRLTALPLLAASVLVAALFFHSYFGVWAERISQTFYADFLSAVESAGEQDFDRYVITPDVQYTGSRQTSEILTLFQLGLDAEYFQGKTDEPLPYRERFQYRNLTPEDLAAPQKGTCWVLKRSALPALPSGWQVQDCGSYVILFYGG